MNAAWAQHDMFFILHVCKHACARKIDDIISIIQSFCVHTRRVHDSLQTHAFMSGVYMLNLDCVCKDSGINSMNTFMY